MEYIPQQVPSLKTGKYGHHGKDQRKRKLLKRGLIIVWDNRSRQPGFVTSMGDGVNILTFAECLYCAWI